MAKNVKVNSPNSSDDELDEEDEVASLISQYGKGAATKIMKLIMKIDEMDDTTGLREKNPKLLKRTLPMKGRKTRGLRTLSKPMMAYFLR